MAPHVSQPAIESGNRTAGNLPRSRRRTLDGTRREGVPETLRPDDRRSLPSRDKRRRIRRTCGAKPAQQMAASHRTESHGLPQNEDREAFNASPCDVLRNTAQAFIGEGGIRTPGTVLPARRFSKAVLSTTQPPLQSRTRRSNHFANSLVRVTYRAIVVPTRSLSAGEQQVRFGSAIRRDAEAFVERRAERKQE